MRDRSIIERASGDFSVTIDFERMDAGAPLVEIEVASATARSRL